MITESDKQHLVLMKKSICFFEQNEPSLDSLLAITNSLEELLDELKNIDDQWKENFRTEWWELELLSSVMMDNKDDNLTEEDKEVISEVLEHMKDMIETALNVRGQSH